MKQLLLFAVTAIFITSCNNAGNKENVETKFDIASVKNQIFEMNKTYGTRFTTNDSVFYLDHYCIDAVVMPANMPAVTGRQAIQKFFYGDGLNKEMVIELPDGNIYGTEDMVVEESTFNFPDGKGGSYDKGKFIVLWKQEDGKWKMYREIWNSDNPPPAPAK